MFANCFEGKKALVTGANRGIGKALVIALAELKANVVALGRNESQLNELKDQYPNVSVVICDVTESAERIAAALSPFQPFNYLVNNAGIGSLENFLDVKEDSIDKTFAVNVRGPLLISQAVVKEMIRHSIQGAVVNVSSISSNTPLQGHTVYCATKAALDMASRVMAMELGTHSIRVNCVNPTAVMTDMGKMAWSDPVKADSLLRRTPLKRFAELEDVTTAVLFLLSDQSAMTTGMAFPVDGGYLSV